MFMRLFSALLVLSMFSLGGCFLFDDDPVPPSGPPGPSDPPEPPEPCDDADDDCD